MVLLAVFAVRLLTKRAKFATEEVIATHVAVRLVLFRCLICLRQPSTKAVEQTL